MNEVAADLRCAMIATGATPYSDDAHRGLVRYIQVVVERRSQTAQVVVVTNDARPNRARRSSPNSRRDSVPAYIPCSGTAIRA